jgi:predicted transcriptional regulator YdeE
VRTTNQNGQAAQDIPALWNRFLTEGIAEKIPNKIDNAIYCIYTDYERDHTRPYTTILGCKVSTVEAIPEGMVSKTIEAATYAKHTAQGSLLQGVVFNAWTQIWNADLPRTFTADFEVYDEKAQNPENAEVEIFVAVQNS